MIESLKKKWRLLFSEMTIEPAMLIHMLGLGASSVVGDTLFIERVCRISLEKPRSICANLSSHEEIEKQASAVVSMYQMYANLILSGFPIFFALFLGSWIDRHGTKFPMLLSVFGFICSNLLCAFMALKEDLPPWVLLFSGMPSALVGGVTAFLMAMLTFISRKTTEESRSFRIGVMESGWFIGYSSGVQIGSMVYEAFGYAAVFLTAAGFVSLAFVHLCVFMKEEPIPSNLKTNGGNKSSCFSKMTDMFQISSVKETFKTCFKRRESSRRLWLILLVSMICIRVLAQDGAISLAYLYTRAKFGWTNKLYSYYLQTEIILRFAGLLIMIGGINALKWKDTGLGIFSAFGFVVGHFVYAFAQKGWMMYLGAAIQTPCVLITILIRSAISKLVNKDELGRIFSFVAVGEACVPLVSALIFNPIYSHTIHTFPGTIFLVAAALHGVITIQFVYLFFAMRKIKTTDSVESMVTMTSDQMT